MTTPSWMPPPEEIPSLWSDAIVEAFQTGRTDVQVFAEIVAIAAVEAYKKSLKPVAWTSVFGSPVWLGGITKDQDVADGWQQHGGTVVPLYRLDGGNDDNAA